MLRFFVTFVAMLAALFGLELTPVAQRYFVVPWTDALAAVSARLVTIFDPTVTASGNVLQSRPGGFAVAIEAGCNGVEATLVLAAAMLAFPAPWRRKLSGLAIGILAVQGLNIIRVISLFYLGQWNYRVFEWAHLYVWQALIMLDVLVVWLVWVHLLPPSDASSGPPRGPGRGSTAPASA